MATIWAFLADPAHREVLSWAGGGLAVICGALWTLLTFFHKPAVAPSDPGGSRTTTTNSNSNNGVSGWALVALVGALAGAIVLVVTLNGPRVTATDGSGGVSGSSITTGR